MRLQNRMKKLLMGISMVAGISFAGGSYAQVASGDCKKSDGTSGLINSVPYAIALPGTYCLGKTLSITGNTTAITISASNVTVDLNSHSLLGPRANGVPGPSIANAWGFSFYSASNVIIRNGIISGFEVAAAFANGGTNKSIVFENLKISNNSSGGIAVIINSRCDDCIVRNNVFSRIDANLCTNCSNFHVQPIYIAGERSQIIGNTIIGMKGKPNGFGSVGIYGGHSSLIEGNVIESESADKLDTGIQATFGVGLPDNQLIINNRMMRMRYGIDFLYSTAPYSGNMTSATTTPYSAGGTPYGLNF